MNNCPNCPYPHSPCISTSMTECKVTTDQLIKQINDALCSLYTNDYYLIEKEVNEVCISTHFWYYFKSMFSYEYVGYNIDPEYNRNGTKCKYFDMDKENKLHSAKPDLIIHKRSCNKYNFAYFEFKGYWNNRKEDEENDEKKLIAFTSPHDLFFYDCKFFSYHYTHGIKIKLYLEYADITWYSNGKVKPELSYRWDYDKSQTPQGFPILPG